MQKENNTESDNRGKKERKDGKGTERKR